MTDVHAHRDIYTFIYTHIYIHILFLKEEDGSMMWQKVLRTEIQNICILFLFKNFRDVLLD